MANEVQIVIGTMPNAKVIFEYVQYYLKSIFAEDYGFENHPDVNKMCHVLLDQFLISAASSNTCTQVTAFHNTLASVYAIIHHRWPFVSFWQVEQLCYEIMSLPAYEELFQKIDQIFKQFIADRTIWKFDIGVDHRKLVIGVGGYR